MYVRLKSMKNRMNTLVSIVDYGVGNLSNIQRAFNIIGVNSIITSKPKEIMNSSHLLLPGVGAFEEGMTNLKNQNLVETVLEFSHSGRSVLGICLGMQLLLSCSYEGGKYSGLNLIEGEVIPLKKTLDIKIIQEKGNFNGGYCLLEKEKIIVINKLKPILLVQKSVKNSTSEDKVIEFSENNIVFLVLRISFI